MYYLKIYGTLLRSLSFLLILLSFLEIVSSGWLLDVSNGYHLGGIYYALTSFITGLKGLYVKYVGDLSWLSGFAFINFIACLVGLTFATDFVLLTNDIEACGYYKGSSTLSNCNIIPAVNFSNFGCDGNEEYFPEAALCTKRDFDEHGLNNRKCSCVTVSNKCHQIEGFTDCDFVIDPLPTLVYLTYITAIIGLTLSLALAMISCIISRHYPNEQPIDAVYCGKKKTPRIQPPRPTDLHDGSGTKVTPTNAVIVPSSPDVVTLSPSAVVPVGRSVASRDTRGNWSFHSVMPFSEEREGCSNTGVSTPIAISRGSNNTVQPISNLGSYNRIQTLEAPSEGV